MIQNQIIHHIAPQVLQRYRTPRVLPYHRFIIDPLEKQQWVHLYLLEMSQVCFSEKELDIFI